MPRILFCVVLIGMFKITLGQKYHRTIFWPDFQIGTKLSVLNNTIKDEMGNKVAWKRPSFVSPNLVLGLNVYNPFRRLEYGIRLQVIKNLASSYKNIERKDTLVINRFWQFSPGLYIKYKFGNYWSNRYWIGYAEANYNLNFGVKRKEMKYRYEGFDPFHDEFKIINGLSNLVRQSPLGKKFNKTKDVFIKRKAGPSVSFGIGREWRYENNTLGCVIALTKDFYNLYDKNYILADNVKPFENWKQSNLSVELKFLYRLSLEELLETAFNF